MKKGFFMRWFLSQPKTRSRSRSSNRYGAAPPREWDPRRTLRGLRYLGIAVAVGVSIFGWSSAESYLARYATARAEVPASGDRVILMDAPLWMNQVWQDDLRRLVAAQVDRSVRLSDHGSVLDNQDLQRAAFVLSQNPWVRQVHRIERYGGGRVRVWALYREPVAVVEGRDGYHLVDAQAVRLPGLYLRHQLAQLTLPLIVGVASAPSHEGAVWAGGDLIAGLSLVRCLGEQPYIDQIRNIDVSGRDSHGRVHLVLHTDAGVVRWGLSPVEEQSIEPSGATKAMWLAEVYRQRGRIDAGGKIVDLFGPAVFVHQPTYDTPGAANSYTWSR
jgi:hypothetical protein